MFYQICKNCILDTSEPTIEFDDSGLCHYCKSFLNSPLIFTNDSNSIHRASDLEKTLKQIKKQGEKNKYDCIIGLSGGVDSSYVAYVVKKMGLRPLAVHLDNGWNSEIAVNNIENLCKILDIDLFTYVINWREFKDLQLSFLKASVRNAEAPTDHAIFATLYKVAHDNNIKWIIDGVNNATEYLRLDTLGAGYPYSDLKHILAIQKLFGTIKIKTFPRLSYIKKLYLKHFIGIRQFSLLDYLKYDKSEAIKILINQFGWRKYGEKHHESLFTKWHQTIHLPQKFKYDKRRVQLSDMILSGQITRDKAISEIENKPINDIDKNLLEEYVIKKLGITKSDYISILNTKEVSYKNYPNQEWIMKLYRKFK